VASPTLNSGRIPRCASGTLRAHPPETQKFSPLPWKTASNQGFFSTAAPTWSQTRTAASNREARHAHRQPIPSPASPAPEKQNQPTAPRPANDRATECYNLLQLFNSPSAPRRPYFTNLRCNQMQPNATFFAKREIPPTHFNVARPERAQRVEGAQNEATLCPKMFTIHPRKLLPVSSPSSQSGTPAE
jgi:hypothetical protein